MHLISSTFHPPSAVLYSLSCSFRDSDERYLVVLRTDKLQIYVLQPHGTEQVCEKEIWGLPKGLIQLESSKHLVLALDIPRARILILDFDPRTSELLVHHTSTISPLAHRPSVGFSGILGSNQSVCASFYNGHVKVLEVDSKAPYEVKESDLRVHELTIRTMCFTLPASDAVLAIVYTDQNGTAWIIGRSASTMDTSLHIPEKELETVPDLAIPVRIESASEGDTFGILLFARKSVTFIKPGGDQDTSEDGKQSGKGKGKVRANRSKSEVKAAIQANLVTIEVPFTDVAGWTQVDGTHLVVGDSFGRLYLLTMSMEPEFKMSSILLGQVSVPSTLSYLSNNILYVGSHSAPSQLVRISENITAEESSISRGKKKQPDDDSGHIEIMTIHNENIAPIMDAILVDVDGSGQSRIATISGDDSGGWLNVTYKGASFRELAVLDGSANLDNVFPLKKYFDADNHTYLVATTNTATFLLSLSESALTLLSPGEIPGISRTVRTILIANTALPGVDAVVHVTPNNVTLVDLVTGRGIGSWNPPKGDITAAAVDTKLSAICVATSQGHAYCLSMQPAGLVKASECSFKSRAHSEVSSLAIHGRIVAATFWGSNDTLLLDFPKLQKLDTLPEEPSAASNVLLTNFGESQTYLIAARLDGVLVIQAISSDGAPLPATRRVVPLGGGPIHLATIPATESSGIRVVAGGGRAVALSIIKKRLSVSALPISDVCALSAINAPGIGPSIVYASVTGLVFGQIEQMDKLNITSFNLGNDSPLRLAHHADLSAYVVGCMRSGVDAIEERHVVRFIDDATFKDLGQVKLKYSEMVTSMTSYTHDGNSCVLVGTGILSSGENEPQAGRIIVFKADSESGLFKLEGSKDVDGAVSSIKQLKGRIIAAINYGVYVFNLTDDESAISESLAKWERGYVLDDVIVRENLIVISDKLRSVSVLRLVETTETPEPDDEDEDVDMDRSAGPTTLQLETIAMDMHAVWPTSIELLEDNKTIIAAQLDGNILTWEIDGGNLEPRAAYYIGEVVNRFIVLPPKSVSGPKPVALFVTNTGRIVTLSTVDDNDALQLTRLEMKMGNMIEGLGGVTHADWRAPKLLHSGVKPPPRRGITDGDFIKAFLELDAEFAEKILSEGSAAEKISPAEEEQIRSCLDALVSEQYA